MVIKDVHLQQAEQCSLIDTLIIVSMGIISIQFNLSSEMHTY